MINIIVKLVLLSIVIISCTSTNSNIAPQTTNNKETGQSVAEIFFEAADKGNITACKYVDDLIMDTLNSKTTPPEEKERVKKEYVDLVERLNKEVIFIDTNSYLLERCNKEQLINDVALITKEHFFSRIYELPPARAACVIRFRSKILGGRYW